MSYSSDFLASVFAQAQDRWGITIKQTPRDIPIYVWGPHPFDSAEDANTFGADVYRSKKTGEIMKISWSRISWNEDTGQTQVGASRPVILVRGTDNTFRTSRGHKTAGTFQPLERKDLFESRWTWTGR